MAAATQEERDQWMTAIEDSIEENPFCRLELGNDISIYEYEFSIFTFYVYYMNIYSKPLLQDHRGEKGLQATHGTPPQVVSSRKLDSVYDLPYT